MKKHTEPIREQNTEQLYKQLAVSYEKLRETRFKIANMEVKDSSIKSKVKKQIARLFTIIREKEAEKVMASIKKD
ncbi:50S ribosomal protein L29 [Candidatus Microgenomates bacterium]|nr:50S ribosomal protein L29 [Candidatus Microgenomates bacterium]